VRHEGTVSCSKRLLLLAVVIAAASLTAPKIAKTQECNDCYQYTQSARGTFPQQAQCCFSGTSLCETLQERSGATLVTMNQSQCFIVEIPDGYACDDADFPCDPGDDGGGGGSGGGGSGGSCAQVPGGWCPPSCSSCFQTF
jgi:hypothetical protein